MSDSVNWRFHSRHGQVLRQSTRSSRLAAKQEIGQERRLESSVAEHVPYADLTDAADWPLFVGFEALAQRRDAVLGGLIPLHEKTALITFIGMGITDPSRYQDAAAAFNELQRMAPAEHGAVIQVFTQNHREDSKGIDFLYLHFAGDRLAFGFLICALLSGGFMAGWQLS